jgi:hypothetical protein
MDPLDKRHKRRSMDRRLGLWNVRSLYRAGSLMTVLREVDGEYTFFNGKRNENHELSTAFCA